MEKEESISIAADKLEKTINSLLDQEKKPCKIVIMDINCNIKQSEIQKWMQEISPQVYNNGVQDFKYHKMVNGDNTFKKNLIILHKTFIDKPLGIRIKTKDGERKSKLKVNYFATIAAGSTYESGNVYSKVRDLFVGANGARVKSLVFFSNIEVDGEVISLYKKTIIDKSPCIYFSQGFKHFIDAKDEKSIMDTYRYIDKSRNETVNKLNSEVKTIVFKKIKEKVICCQGKKYE